MYGLCRRWPWLLSAVAVGVVVPGTWAFGSVEACGGGGVMVSVLRWWLYGCGRVCCEMTACCSLFFLFCFGSRGFRKRCWLSVLSDSVFHV